MDDFDKKKLNREYKEEFDDILFNDIVVPLEYENTLLGNFLKRQMKNTEDDYGWLEPSGEFHPVDWGKHQEWAENYINSNFSEEEWMKVGITKAGIISTISGFGDYLTTKGWILLHNPAQGIAIVTKKNECRITKAQKEFLYDYYMKRDCENEANELYQERE